VTLKQRIFWLLGKDPEAVVVSFCSGPESFGRAMVEEIRQLVPDRRHFAVSKYSVPGIPTIAPEAAARELKRFRIGLAPVLIGTGTEFAGERRLAVRLAPFKLLAYNPRLERHHLRLSTPVASVLFLRGVALDRIWLRPYWLAPWRRDRSVFPDRHQVHEGSALRERRPRVAVLSPYFPYPLSHGGAVRIFNLLREASRDFDIFLFAFSEDTEAARATPVLEFCSKVVLFPNPRYREPRWSTLRPPQVNEYESDYARRILSEFRHRYNLELTQVEYTQLATYAGDVLVEHDVTFDLYSQVHGVQESFSSWWDLRRWRQFEQNAVKRYRRVVVMSEKDAGLLPGARTSVIPNGVDLQRFQPQPETPGRRALFVGSFAHFPNVVAYRFFLEQVMPIIQDEAFRWTVIAGRDPQLYEPAAPADPRVEFYGFIHDVRPFYQAANLVVVPTRVSAGTNLKVLEAMAQERAVVSTPSGVAGLGLEHDESVWIAESASQFANAIELLLTNESLRRRLARRGRQIAEEKFGWSAIGRLQRQLWTELLRGVVVRQATHPDLNAIQEIQRACGTASQWNPESYFAFDFRVAEKDGRVAAFMVSRTVAPDETEVLNLATHPAMRRCGAATALIESLPSTAVYLEVRESNHPARQLYEKLGFRVAGKRMNYYDDPQEHALTMELRRTM
jgi:glycosyltransferase involved in cell wall biosynthesis/ribosomal protein S18 acetylase RimI-like enzyme